MNFIRKFAYKSLNRILYSGFFGEVGLRKHLLFYLPDTPITYIDVGAFRGDFFDVLLQEKKIAAALLIEPQDDLFEELKQKFSNHPAIELRKNVLSDKEEEISFFVQEMKATSSILRINKTLEKDLQMESGKEIRMTSTFLDALTTGKFPVIDLLKIDVQGAELKVLKGAINTLSRTKKIWVEVSFRPLYSDSAVFLDIYSFLNEQGFVLRSILEGYRSNNKELLQADCLFEKPE